MLLLKFPCYEVMNSLLHIILSFLLQALLPVAQSAQLATVVNDIVCITNGCFTLYQVFSLTSSFFPGSFNVIGNNIGYIESWLNLPWKMHTLPAKLLHCARKAVTLCPQSCYTVPAKLLHCARKAVTLCLGNCYTVYWKLLHCALETVTLCLGNCYTVYWKLLHCA